MSLPAATAPMFPGTASAVPHSHARARGPHVAVPAPLDEPTDVPRNAPDVHRARLAGADCAGASAASCRTGTAAAAGRRAVVEAPARVDGGGAAAAMLIPASNPSQDHKKRGSDE